LSGNAVEISTTQGNQPARTTERLLAGEAAHKARLDEDEQHCA
jgi:hypothetical protein